MKKVFVFLLVFTMLMLSSCMASHYHLGPALNEYEVWVCDEVDMWFNGSRYGEITLDGEVIPFTVHVDDIEFSVLMVDPPVFGEDDLIIVGDPVYPRSNFYLMFHEYDFDYFTVILKKNYDFFRYNGILDSYDDITTLTFRKVIVEATSTE